MVKIKTFSVVSPSREVNSSEIFVVKCLLLHNKTNMKIIVVGLCVCFLIGNGNVHGQLLGMLGIGSGTSPLDKFNPINIAQSGGDTIKGVASKLPSLIPSADTIFSVGKNVLAGYPVEAAFTAINLFCKYIFLSLQN